MCPVYHRIPVLKVASSFDGAIQLFVLVFSPLRGVNNIVPKIWSKDMTMFICTKRHTVGSGFLCYWPTQRICCYANNGMRSLKMQGRRNPHPEAILQNLSTYPWERNGTQMVPVSPWFAPWLHPGTTPWAKRLAVFQWPIRHLRSWRTGPFRHPAGSTGPSWIARRNWCPGGMCCWMWMDGAILCDFCVAHVSCVKWHKWYNVVDQYGSWNNWYDVHDMHGCN